jgi:signal transduction histidine kinase
MKKLPAALREHDAFMRNAPLPCLLVDRQGRVAVCNAAAGNLLRTDPEEMAGTLVDDFFRPAGELHTQLRARKRSVPVRDLPGKILLPSGSSRPVTLRAQRLNTESRRVYFQVWVHDESELREMKSRLEKSEKLSAMAIVAGKVAHEIRTPLNAIFLNNDLLQARVERMRGAQGVKLRRYIGILQEEVERLNEIVLSYLSLSRLAGGDREATPIEDFLGHFVDEVREEYGRHRISIVTAFRAKRREVTLNRRQFRRVMLNLFSNCRDAMKGGGVITVSTDDAADSYRITVSDTGEGIPPDSLSRLTTPFTSLKSNGTGLGLYLVSEIVERHGGRLDIRSLQGAGTSVIISLPCVKA